MEEVSIIGIDLAMAHCDAAGRERPLHRESGSSQVLRQPPVPA